jgi:phenylalanine-4-hydroxylase
MQLVGIASLGASDEDIEKLGAIYWYTIEFGLLRDKKDVKVFGAGILAGVDDIKYCFSGKPEFLDLNLHYIADNCVKHQIAETRSKFYFVEDSFDNMKQ